MVNDTIISLWSIIFQGLTAVGTITVTIMAIWGDWVRSHLVPPKLTIRAHNLRGNVTVFSSSHPDLNNKRVIYYHLKVVNSRPWSPAKNCRVLLRAIWRRAPNQQFVTLPMVVPSQFVWAPAQLTPPSIALSNEHIFDFGMIIEGFDHFAPVLYAYGNDFAGRVQKGQAIRYALEIVADGFIAPNYHVFEVAWDGNWSDNLDDMEHSLTIREITQEIQSPNN